MHFTEEQVATINKHIEEFGLSTCSLCGGDQWSLHPHLTALCAQQPNGVNLFNALQVIQVVCETCGQIVSFSGEKMGISVNMKLKAK